MYPVSKKIIFREVTITTQEIHKKGILQRNDSSRVIAFLILTDLSPRNELNEHYASSGARRPC